MAIVQEMNLNMIPDSAPVIVRIDQYDTGAGRLVAHLYAGDKMYIPAEGSAATIQGTKPDMHGFAYNAVLEDSTVTADLTQQMSCIAGNTRCQFVVVEPTGRTGTFAFILKIQESALADDTDISETEIPAIIDAAGKNAEKAEESAEKAEAAVEHYPYINMDNLHWMVWDADTETWIDTGVVAEGSGYTPGLGIKIDQSTISVDSDAAPTEDSQKPVASGGVYEALEEKQPKTLSAPVTIDGETETTVEGAIEALNTYTGTKQDELTAGTGINIANNTISVDADATPTEGSNKPVTSNGVYEGLQTKQDGLTFDNTPIEGSSNPVKSGGVYTALESKQNVLTAGENVRIENNTISATDTTYEPATQATAGLMSASDKTKLDGIEAGAEVNVQADYAQTNTAADDYIKNKPELGTAAAKNATNAVTAGSTDLVESGAVKTAIDAAVSSAYKPAGPKTCAELVPALLVEANNGNVYNITDDGVTTEDFIEESGKPIRIGDNVGICKVGNVYKFDLLSGFIDTSGLQTKTITGTVEGQTTVEGALGALSTNKQPKNLSTPITVDGTQQTTVEGTLSAINNLAATNKTNKQDKTLSSAIESQTTVEGALGALSTNKQPKTLSTPITVDDVQKTTVEGAVDAINDLATANKTAINNLGTAATKDATDTISSGNTNLIESGAVYTALNSKQDTLSAGTGITIANNTVSVDADITPTQNSAKPITSGGAYTALEAKQPKTMSTPITVDGTQETTVEGAISAINTLAAGNKTAIADIKNSQNINSFADVESALANKQDALGLYIDDDGYICQD